MDIWIETVHSQRNTILLLKDQVIKERRYSEQLDSRLKEEQTTSAAQHPIATKSPTSGDARKVLELKQTIVDLTQKLQNLETTFGDRLDEAKKLIRPGFEEEVKKNWILLSRCDDWQALKEIKVWCHNHGLMVVEAGTNMPTHNGGQQFGLFGSSYRNPSGGGGFFNPFASVFGVQGNSLQQPIASGGSGTLPWFDTSGQQSSPPPWSGQTPGTGSAPPPSQLSTGTGTPGQTPGTGGSETDLPGPSQPSPRTEMSGQPPSENSPGSDAPGQPLSGIPPSSGTTPSTSGTGTLGLSTTQTTVATTNTLKDPYPVSIKSIRSLKNNPPSYTSNAQMAHFTTWNSCGGRNAKPLVSPPKDHLNGLGEREMIEFHWMMCYVLLLIFQRSLRRVGRMELPSPLRTMNEAAEDSYEI